MKNVSQADVDKAIAKPNFRPRKGLEFKTPSQLMSRHEDAIAA